MKDSNCGYCMRGELLDKFGIFICDLQVSSLILFKDVESLIICGTILQIFFGSSDGLYVFQKKQYYLLILSMLVFLLCILYIILLKLLKLELTKVNAINVIMGFVALSIRLVFYCLAIMWHKRIVLLLLLTILKTALQCLMVKQ